MHAGHWANIYQTPGPPLTSSWYSDFSLSCRDSLLFKQLVPTAWRQSLSWGSSVNPFPLGAPSFAQILPVAYSDGLCWESETDRYTLESKPGAQRLLSRVIRHLTLDVCHKIICGLGSKLSCKWSKLWGEWKRVCGVAIMGSIPRSTIYEILVKPAQQSGPQFPH